MSYFLAALVTLRLVMWRVFPQFGMEVVSDGIFGMLAFTVYVLYLVNKRYTRFTPWIFLLVISTVISFFYSPNLPLTFNTWFLLLINILGFVLAVQHLRNKEAAPFLWLAMLLGATVAALVGIWEFFILRSYAPSPTASMAVQSIYAAKRSCSFLGWPTIFAGYLVLFIPSAWVMARDCRPRNKVFWSACLIFLLLGLASSFSVLAPLSLLSAVIISGNVKRLRWMLIVVGLVLFSAGSTKTLASFIASRTEYYQAAWQMISQHPFVGGGAGLFQSTGSSPSIFAHNSYLQIWAETGPIGLIGILGVVYTFWTLKPKTNFGKGMYVGLLAFFIDNLFSFSLIKANLSFAGWIALACYYVYYRKESMS